MKRPAEEPDPKRSTSADCDAGPRLAAELQALRARTGKSLKELEQLVHASDSSISRYLSGRIVPPWSVIERLSRLAGDEPARLRPLWDHLTGDGHRQGDCPPLSEPLQDPAPPPPESSATAGDRVPLRRVDRRGRLVIAVLIAVTALVFGGAGVIVGWSLAPRSRPVPVVQQFAACKDWPWPGRQDGQAALAPVQVHGRDHTATVQLLTRSIGGREMVWAQITHARYGDRVWMDWTRNDGKTWTQCGPFTTTGATFSSRAHEMAPGWRFRACGDTPRWPTSLPRDACTAFW
ncbi:helix-turn-helix domain-containing protein [Actinoallomurus sp. NBC_01490]|uniref:helix-turn-helix domain-containing protein n=1 Tax=Actinoallomurus sp. NBC_01490 TaxID=2903557 RepID=UPI002E33EA3A|nr:helix-turn-helix transcriptional regulator [Actinoallomurus sp. NBC_01490]